MAIQRGFRLVAADEGISLRRALDGLDMSRQELCVLGILMPRPADYHSTIGAFYRLRDSLGVDVIDLLAIPCSGSQDEHLIESWKAMIQLRDARLVRAIGTIDSTKGQLTLLAAATAEAPTFVWNGPSLAEEEEAESEFYRRRGIAAITTIDHNTFGVLSGD